MARFYSLKKKDEDDAKTADPFGVLRPKVKNAEQQQVNIYEMAKAYVFLADGFEDIEALAPVDILRRGGIDVKTVSINATDMVASAHGVQVKADMMFADADFSDADLLMLPGGMPGAKNLDEHEACARRSFAMPSSRSSSVPSALRLWCWAIWVCSAASALRATRASRQSLRVPHTPPSLAPPTATSSRARVQAHRSPTPTDCSRSSRARAS